MSFPTLSPKQRRLFQWWADYDAVICDGAVRSGKTYAMGIAFFLWAMSNFTGRQFGLCATTQNGVRRNLLLPGEPADFERLRPIIEEILPCHLDISYRFRYNTWGELMELVGTWGEAVQTGMTWGQLAARIA